MAIKKVKLPNNSTVDINDARLPDVTSSDNSNILAVSSGAWAKSGLKTINNNSLLGTGNITIESGGSAGTLNTTLTTSQSTSSSESFSNTINLHKISKTGDYDDLIDKPITYDSSNNMYVGPQGINNAIIWASNEIMHDAGGGSYETVLDTGNYSSYVLPLSGGTMTTTNLITNLNADRLDGMHLSGINWTIGVNNAGTGDQWIIFKTDLDVTAASHRFVFFLFGTPYTAGDKPICSAITGRWSTTDSTFVSNSWEAVNLGKEYTWYLANIDGYIALFTKVINGVSIWATCQAGQTSRNRISEAIVQATEPTSTKKKEVVNTSLSQFLPLSGGTMSGAIILPNATTLQGLDTGSTARTLLGLDASNNVNLAYGAAGAGYTTNVDGNVINLKYGTSHTTGFTLDSDGNVQLTGVLRLANTKSLAIADSGGTNRSCVEFSSANNFLVGYGAASGGYTTRVDGNEIQLRYGTSHTTGFTLNSSGNCTAVGSVTASSFVKSGGTSSQYLRADGSVGTITISSSDPTSSTGSNGDIWIKI